MNTIDIAANLDITMPLYNFIEYSDNFSGSYLEGKYLEVYDSLKEINYLQIIMQILSILL